MAFKNKSQKTGVATPIDGVQKTTALEIGESLEGYLLRLNEYTDKETGEVNRNFVLLIDDKRIRIYPSGNIKYMLQDGKLDVGMNTRITRVEDKMVGGKDGKRKMKATDFLVEQDDEDVLSEEAIQEAFARPGTYVSPNAPAAGAATAAAAPASKGARERANVAAKIKQLNGN